MIYIYVVISFIIGIYIGLKMVDYTIKKVPQKVLEKLFLERNKDYWRNIDSLIEIIKNIKK